MTSTLFIENLSTIDFSYYHHDRGIVGESLIVDIALTGELNDQGMIYDFSTIKKRIKGEIDVAVDHKLLVPADSAKVAIDRLDGGNLAITASYGQHGYCYHASPDQAVVLLPEAVVDQAAIERCLQQRLQQVVPDNVLAIKIDLRTEQIAGPYYHYSHGLKHHQGNCQRIAHGHRSKLLCYRDGSYDQEMTAAWCQRWRDIYLASMEDLVASYTRNGVLLHQFSYDSAQGHFRLDLPASQVELIATDTTVECITNYIGQSLQDMYPGVLVGVRNYEGVDKGAIFTSQERV